MANLLIKLISIAAMMTSAGSALSQGITVQSNGSGVQQGILQPAAKANAKPSIAVEDGMYENLLKVTTIFPAAFTKKSVQSGSIYYTKGIQVKPESFPTEPATGDGIVILRGKTDDLTVIVYETNKGEKLRFSYPHRQNAIELDSAAVHVGYAKMKRSWERTCIFRETLDKDQIVESYAPVTDQTRLNRWMTLAEKLNRTYK